VLYFYPEPRRGGTHEPGVKPLAQPSWGLSFLSAPLSFRESTHTLWKDPTIPPFVVFVSFVVNDLGLIADSSGAQEG
jgi:hypothetical protein